MELATTEADGTAAGVTGAARAGATEDAPDECKSEQPEVGDADVQAAAFAVVASADSDDVFHQERTPLTINTIKRTRGFSGWLQATCSSRIPAIAP